MDSKVKRNKVWVEKYVADEASEAAVADISSVLGLTR